MCESAKTIACEGAAVKDSRCFSVDRLATASIDWPRRQLPSATIAVHRLKNVS
jgi:hypothetical protein